VHFTTKTSADGIVEREFTVDSAGDHVPGVLWTPESAADHLPLVLLCHGGGQHKKAPAMTGRAGLLLNGCGFAVACLDAPGHGGRPKTETDEREFAALLAARAAGEPEGPVVERYNADIAARAVPEWRAALDALEKLPELGGPVGYYGINMGTAIGVPLTAVEPRISAAVFGQFWHGSLIEAARRITVPLEFALQWDDEHIPRESGLALFDAFASKQKSLHANAGRHKELPRFEADSATRFFARHLRRT